MTSCFSYGKACVDVSITMFCETWKKKELHIITMQEEHIFKIFCFCGRNHLVMFFNDLLLYKNCLFELWIMILILLFGYFFCYSCLVWTVKCKISVICLLQFFLLQCYVTGIFWMFIHLSMFYFKNIFSHSWEYYQFSYISAYTLQWGCCRFNIFPDWNWHVFAFSEGFDWYVTWFVSTQSHSCQNK